MKKICSFICKLIAVTGFIAGLYWLYQKFVANCDFNDEEDESDFDDFDFDEEDFTETASDTREYVTLNASESKNVSEDDDKNSKDLDDFVEISD
ncbi:MAG: hypothetical protein HFJ09_14350 [Lachnospiraceae bacterium]|nr:hypothetical protein [Lachnospiraceae bacterium]